MLQPASQDVWLIEQARRQAASLPTGSPSWIFYDNLAADTQAMNDHIRRVEEEQIEGPLPETE